MTETSLVKGLDHVAAVVYDIDKSLEYLVDVLGLRVVHAETLSNPPVRLVYLDLKNTFLQLVQPTGDSSIADHLKERGEGLHHMGFATDDISRCLASLPGEANQNVFRGGMGVRASFLANQPAGILVELIQGHDLYDLSPE